MGKLCKRELCNGCSVCASICAKGCISMEADHEGFLRPVIDETRCVQCGRCQQVCPILQEPSIPEEVTLAYGAINKDDQVRFESTSGGIFSLLCQLVIEQGGVVFGAAYNESFEVVHCLVEEKEDLSKLRGAKYAQSTLGDTFIQVQECLKKGRKVLFSGTPCQVGGLVSFLGGKYDNLILVDLICHGVPSPKVWKSYIDYRSVKDAAGNKPVSINLRSKETGWPGYSVRFDYPNDAFYLAKNIEDPYLRGFVGDLFLRPSCYECRFKGYRRQSDVTLGDYWGVWDQLPDYHDGKGTSLVLIHSEKARRYWESIAQYISCSEVDVKESIIGNPSAIQSSEKPSARDVFFLRYAGDDFSKVIDDLRPMQKSSISLRSYAKKIVHKAKSKAFDLIKGNH